jgi:secreted Zn-dependent insulinase-like peptidase
MIGPDVTTTQSEAYFGTPYKVEPLAATTLAKWHNPRPQENFFLPSANPYIPEHTSIPPGAEKKEPEHVIDEAGINFWLQVDEQYFGPRGKIELTLSSPQAGGTPQLCAKAQLYAALINEQVNEWAYQAMLAGTSLRFSASDRGLEITIAGYSSNISPLLARLGKTIKTITDDVATFSAVKDQVKQQLANNLMYPAYQRGGDELSYLLTTSTIASTSYYDPAQGIDEISPLSLDDMRQYSSEFFREVGMAGSAYGSFSAGEIEETLRTFVTALHALPFVRSKWPIFSEVQLPSGQSLVRVSARPSSDDFALVSYQQFGRRSPASLAALRVGDAILRSHFYEDLRTTQQVGYIVGMQPRFLEKSVGLMFYLQSPHLQPEDLDQRVETWKGNALKLLATLTPQDFATYKQAIAKKLRQPCASLAEAQRSLHFYAFSQGRSSAHETAESLQALTALSKEELLALFEEAFLPTTGQRLSVYLYKENASPSSLDQSTLIKDPEKFRHAQATF